jgi:hypothetical protein
MLHGQSCGLLLLPTQVLLLLLLRHLLLLLLSSLLGVHQNAEVSRIQQGHSKQNGSRM